MNRNGSSWLGNGSYQNFMAKYHNYGATLIFRGFYAPYGPFERQIEPLNLAHKTSSLCKSMLYMAHFLSLKCQIGPKPISIAHSPGADMGVIMPEPTYAKTNP
jgi:hypothetical protein